MPVNRRVLESHKLMGKNRNGVRGVVVTFFNWLGSPGHPPTSVKPCKDPSVAGVLLWAVAGPVSRGTARAAAATGPPVRRLVCRACAPRSFGRASRLLRLL